MIACAAGVLDAIEAHARREYPRECCGLLIGRADRIEEAVPVENCAGDPTRHYEIDPRAHLAAIRRTRGTGRGVLGGYHSHPASAAEPSPTDRAQAFEEFLYVIAGPVAGAAPLAIRAYRLEQGNFRVIRLVPDPVEPGP